MKKLPKRGPQYSLNLITGSVIGLGFILIVLQWRHRGESYDEYEAQAKDEQKRIEELKKEPGVFIDSDPEAPPITEDELLIRSIP